MSLKSMVTKKFVSQVVLGFIVVTNLIVFQNCAKGFKTVEPESLSSLASTGICLDGEVQQGYLSGLQKYPSLCGQKITKVCANGKWSSDQVLYPNCLQQCVRPDNQLAVDAGGSYLTYVGASAATQALCDSTSNRITSTCDQATGNFLPAPGSATCLVAGQTCAYASGNGSATPSGNMTNATVTGFVAATATYPAKCEAQVTRTCQASGQWSGSVPVYSACTQRCIDPGTNMPVNQGSTFSYSYYTIASGTAAQCSAAHTTLASTCSAASGLFSPAPPANIYTACSVINNDPNLGGPVLKIKSMTAGGLGKTCYVDENNLVWCAGGVASGALPKMVQNLGPVKSISYGSAGGHGCAITINDTVRCWGNNSDGQLGVGNYIDSEAALEVPGLSGSKLVATGFNSTCVITATNTVKCWGYGVSLDPTGANGGVGRPTTPVDIQGLTNVKSLALGTRDTGGVGGNLNYCALLTSGEVRCWNVFPPEVDYVGAKSVAAGAGFVCVITAQDTVKCRGVNNFGQLGNNSTVDSPGVYVDVANLTNVKAIFSGYSHSCAITVQNSLKCWGDNGFNDMVYNRGGKLGINSVASFSAVPVDVLNLTNVMTISLGQFHSCAVTLQNEGYCWGPSNSMANLGSNAATSSLVPVDTVQLEGMRSLFGNCGLTEQGKVRCMGSAAYSDRFAPILAEVSALSGIKSIGAAYTFNCLITAQNTVKCWGNGYTGLVDMPGLTGVQLLSSGFGHMCSLDNLGKVMCWSDVAGGPVTGSTTPTEIVALRGAKALAGGQTFACAITAQDSVKCWGYNGGGLGNGSIEATPENPVEVANVTNAKVLVSGGGATMCILTAQNTVKCWGGVNSLAQDVVGLNDVKMISAGESHNCALTNQGAVKCWGRNLNGQLGVGKGDYYEQPISPLLTAKKIRSVQAYANSTYIFFENNSAAFIGNLLPGSLVPVGPIRGPF